jgi:hypothetical protein
MNPDDNPELIFWHVVHGAAAVAVLLAVLLVIKIFSR